MELVYNDQILNLDFLYTTIFDYEDIKVIFEKLEDYLKEFVRGINECAKLIGISLPDPENMKVKKFFDINDILEDYSNCVFYIVTFSDFRL
jgi:hypothetical protein